MVSNSVTQVSQPGLRRTLRSTWRQVWPLLFIALGVRVFFLVIGANIYYAGRQTDIHINGDSYSYLLSFHNLWQYGRYTFDINEPEAAVGRLPGYPFFYGLHYLVFGPRNALMAVAVSQVVLDTMGVWLIYVITARLVAAKSWAPRIAALLLALYPFSVIWVSIAGTETLGLFLVLLWWATLLLARPSVLNWLLLGGLLAVIVYVREFLGICLAVTLVHLVASNRARFESVSSWRPVSMVILGFLSLYVWWPVRNYVTLGRFIPLKPAAAGYANLREDAQAALSWVLTWTNDVTMGFDEILLARKPTFPQYVITTPEEKQLIDSLILLSRTCASSFQVRDQPYSMPTPHAMDEGMSSADYRRQLEQLRRTNCNAQVSAGFTRLRISYIRRHPIRARLEVPLQNFQKILLKNQFKMAVGKKTTFAQRFASNLFVWRSVLLVVGLIGVWRYRRNTGLRPALLFAVSIFGYMAIVFRSMEMRYLLQADVLMLVPAAMLLAEWLPARWARLVHSIAD